MEAQCYLLQKTTGSEPLRINLNRNEVTVGRKTFNALKCFGQVSRRHASFQVSDTGQWFVKDLNSTNGIYINNVKIGPELKSLRNGDIIGFGISPDDFDSELVFLFCCKDTDVSSNRQNPINGHVPGLSQVGASHERPRNEIIEQTVSRSSGSSSTAAVSHDQDSLLKHNSSSSVKSSKKNNCFNYEQKYAHIINSQFPKLVLKKCVLPEPSAASIKLAPHNHDDLLDQMPPAKRQRIERLSTSSESDPEIMVIGEWRGHTRINPSSHTGIDVKQENDSAMHTDSHSGSISTKPKNNYNASTLETSKSFKQEHCKKLSDFSTAVPNIKHEIRFDKAFYKANEPNANDHSRKNSAIGARLEETSAMLPNQISVKNEQDFVPINQDNFVKSAKFSPQFDPVRIIQPFVDRENRDKIQGAKSCKANSDNQNLGYAKNDTAFLIGSQVKIKAERQSPPRDTLLSDNENEKLPQENNVRVKVEAHSDSEGDSVKCINYSQDDEVIVISDDDDYYSIPCSQQVNIKAEPLDDELNMFYQDLEGDRNQDQMSSPPHIFNDDELPISEHDSAGVIPESENVSNIEKFINKKIDPSSIANEEIDEFFPKLSQNFYSSDESSDEDTFSRHRTTASKSGHTSQIADSKERNSNDMHLQRNVIEIAKGESPSISPVLQNKLQRQLSKTLLTDPKPMEHRPRYQRGREEWFVERCSGSKEITGTKKKTSEIEKPSSKKKTEEKTSGRAVQCDKPKKKEDLRKKVREQMGHRIRIPNGGSAIRKRQTPLPRSSASDTCCASKGREVQTGKIGPKLDLPSRTVGNLRRKSATTDAFNMKSERASTVKKRPERFSSRMDFLVASSSKADSANVAVSEKPGVNNVFKIPKLKKSVSQETPKCNSSQNTSRSSLPSHQKCLKPSKPTEKQINKNTVTLQNKKESNFPATNVLAQKRLPIAKISPSSSSSSSRKQDFGLLQPIETVPRILNDSVKSTTAFIQPVLYQNEISDPRLRPRTQADNRRPCMQSCSTQNSIIPQSCTSHKDVNASRYVTVFSNLSLHMDFDALIAAIVGWNPAWLKQYRPNNKPPPNICQGAVSLPLTFSNLKDYAQCFFALIRLEVWESIFLYWKDCVVKNCGINTIFLMVTKCESLGDLMTLECESVITSNIPQIPQQGNLIIIDLRVCGRRECIKVFGYITNHKVLPMPKSSLLHSEWQQREEIHSEGCKLVTFTLRLKKKCISLDLNKLMKASLMNYIANKVRVVNAFQFMMTSPLTPCILQPNKEAYSLNNFLPSSFPALSGEYNEQQKVVITSICNGVKLHYMHPKIMLLQGPPGTGKTHTIVGVVEALHSKQHTNKILITAPSNAAVDEIGRRLIDLRRSKYHSNSSLSDLRIVRVGTQNIHKDVFSYSLEEQTKMNLKINRSNTIISLEKDYRILTKSIEHLKREIEGMQANNSTSAIRDKMNELKVKGRRLEHIKREIEEASTNPKHTNDYNLKLEILEKADVILTTLSSCGLKMLETVFGPKTKVHFTCCIVDEATQCTEPEILQPLVFGITKFILVGDHQQLPATVQSKLAMDFNYECSLFERVHLYFQKNSKDSPVFMLKTQYRMHSEICTFPSSNFYSNMLVTAPKVDSTYSCFPFKPFTILDIVYGQESNSHSSKANIPEAEAIIEICKQLVKVIPNKYTVGIITPYLAQKHLYLRELSCSSSINSIEVNTVDSFQGREKDVIILSCVRAKSSTGSIGFVACSKRLNVAITRAKQCLIICGHMKSLKHYPLWTNLIVHAKRKECYISVTDPRDISFVLKEMKK